MACFERVAKGSVEADFVDVVAAVLGQVDVAGFDEVMHDAVNGAFADPDLAGDLREANLGVLGDADDDVGVVGQERPRGDVSRLLGETTGHFGSVSGLWCEARPS